MFCTNCGKQIADDSVFCEHCGTKVMKVTQAKESGASEEKATASTPSKAPTEKNEGEIQNEELRKMAEHLEFHGYSVEKVDMENGKEWIIARHDDIHNQVFLELFPGFVLFRASFYTKKKHSAKMDTAVNEANKHLNFAKFYYEIDEDNCATVKFEATYVGDYSKGLFARFQDVFHKEVDMLYQLEEMKAFLNS